MKISCPVSLLFQPGRESLGPVGLPTENCWFADSFKWFYRGFVTRAEGRSDVAKRELNESLTTSPLSRRRMVPGFIPSFPGRIDPGIAPAPKNVCRPGPRPGTAWTYILGWQRP
jgi:hypothetical protein